MRLLLAANRLVDGAELDYTSLGVSCHEVQTPCEVYHMEAFHGAAKRIICVKIGMGFMLGLQSITQKRDCEQEPLIIFGRGANNDVYRTNN